MQDATPTTNCPNQTPGPGPGPGEPLPPRPASEQQGAAGVQFLPALIRKKITDVDRQIVQALNAKKTDLVRHLLRRRPGPLLSFFGGEAGTTAEQAAVKLTKHRQAAVHFDKFEGRLREEDSVHEKSAAREMFRTLGTLRKLFSHPLLGPALFKPTPEEVV